jgi:hypothetical protein
MSFNQPPQPGYGAPQQPNPYSQPAQPTRPQQPASAPPQGGPGYGNPQQPQPMPPQPAQGPGPNPGQYGYPQQQPQPGAPYGGPGFPQQPGQPGGWGAVPPPPPQGGGGKGKVIGIVVGGAAVVAAIVVGIAFTVGGGSGGDYKLSMPASVLSGEYAKNSTTSPALSNGQVGSDNGISDATTVAGQYGKTGGEQYTISGAYGDVSDPNAVVDKMLESMKATTGASSSDAQPEHPDGFDGTVMKCNVMSKTIPYCVWGDDSTVGLVMFADTSTEALTGGKSAKYPTIQDFANDAAKIRSEVRVKK